MKKNDFYNILINLVVTISLTLILVLTSNLSSNTETVIKGLLYLSMLTMYLMISKVTYFNIKEIESKKNFNIVSICYAIAAVLYVGATTYTKNVILIILSLILFFSFMFAYFVYFTAEMYKRIEKKNKFGIIKLVLIHLMIILCCLMSYLIGGKDNLNALYNQSIYIAAITSTISLSVVAFIYIFKKLVFIK